MAENEDLYNVIIFMDAVSVPRRILPETRFSDGNILKSTGILIAQRLITYGKTALFVIARAFHLVNNQTR